MESVVVEAERIYVMSSLDNLIPPEIIDDELYNIIRQLSSDPCIENILEIIISFRV
jgi:hypothetical protein